MVAAYFDNMRVMLDHPAADAAAMMMIDTGVNGTALMQAVESGALDSMRFLLAHPVC
jgi:hypothetical protein